MAQVSRSATVILSLVALAAVGVSFFSSSRARSERHQVASLKKEIEKFSQVTKLLEEDLQRVKQQYEKEALTNKNLQQALLQEEMKNQSLTEELQSAKSEEAETPRTNIASEREQ